MSTEIQANLIEIFTSFQGEGPYVGHPMIFVRFQNCDLACRFCDTPNSFKKNLQYRVERPPFSGQFLWQKNPVSVSELLSELQFLELSSVCSETSAARPKWLSLTGGEPLQHFKFLQKFLPELKNQYRVLLETNGVLPMELETLIDWIDVVSMDIKLPSITGLRSYWQEHEAFLKIARRKEVYVKAVVGSPTDTAELNRALEIVKKIAPEVPFILQPVTPAWQVHETIPESRLKELHALAKDQLQNVRVIPQVHAQIGIY